MNVRLIVPRRADGGHRDRLWAFCRAHWTQLGWPIVEGHHHADEGPWNRAVAINRGAEGDWDVAVILDADVIVDLDSIRRSVDVAAETGRMVLPFRRRMMVNAAGTRRIVDDGYQGVVPWDRFGTPERNKGFCRNANVITRQLWDEVGGCDERFVGWGGEDDALDAACAAVAGVERLDGDVWHLHHAWDPSRQPDSPQYRQTRLLAERYTGLRRDPDRMRALLAEDRGSDQVVVVCLTNGARDTLAKTIHSADEMLAGPIGRKVIVHAPGQTGRGVPARPAPAHDGWETVTVLRAPGYTRAVTAAIDVALGSGQPWVFWLEDDFTFNEPVHLDLLRHAMDAEPRLAQMALMRQPWYDAEIAAGGLAEYRQSQGDVFHQRATHVEHWSYWTMNPMLCRRSFLAKHTWPKQAGSENRFGRFLFDTDADPVCGIWGRLGDPPRVTHIGSERAGRGY